MAKDLEGYSCKSANAYELAQVGPYRYCAGKCYEHLQAKQHLSKKYVQAYKVIILLPEQIRDTS